MLGQVDWDAEVWVRWENPHLRQMLVVYIFSPAVNL